MNGCMGKTASEYAIRDERHTPRSASPGGVFGWDAAAADASRGIKSILICDLLLFDQRIYTQAVSFQIFPVHIHGGNLTVFVGGIIINSSGSIAAAGIACKFIFFIAYTGQAPLLGNAGENVKELADAFGFRISTP